MGLADEIAASHDRLYKSRGPTSICTVRRIENYLDAEDREALKALFADQRVYGTNIVELLNSWGAKIPETLALATEEALPDERRLELEHLAQLCQGINDGSVNRHRRGKCQCGDL